ncbi:hypothetical protein [Solidesulfovibrio sp. C21]|uniref:hypothetical protein n=1 Tax=Solidesulfovibrio sp. C21 TaxID=3398613 RepID=UPI0039FDD313
MPKVFLDHIIPRQNLRYIDINHKAYEYQNEPGARADFRLRDIFENEWFNNLRKPDFQRETNSWGPNECADFLDSLVNNLVIPGIIIWKSDDSGYVFVIDGAHRLSVIRAWMIDDWGENNDKSYNSLYETEIRDMGHATRELVKSKIGSFSDYKRASEECKRITEAGGAPKNVMSPKAFAQSRFYNRIQEGATIPTQWIYGTYEVAEKSFLKINKGGQKLDIFEQSLIEFRNGPYARIAMSIINGKSGHYWPSSGLDTSLQEKIKSFDQLSSAIHKILFVPPFDGAIIDLNQPLVMSKPSQQYEDALELLALISENKFLSTEDSKKEFLQQMHDAPPNIIIENAKTILNIIKDRLSHLVGENTTSKSLSIVPAIYNYNHQGTYSKNLLYAFIYWIFCNKELVQEKKLALTFVRGTFEALLMEYKSNITNIASSRGGSFKSTKEIASTINNIIIKLSENKMSGLDEKSSIQNIATEFGFQLKANKINKSRAASKSQKNTINLEHLFKESTRCPICKGVINLSLGKQYDHFFVDYSIKKETCVENLKPVHPFCNNMKQQLERIARGDKPLSLPETITPDKKSTSNSIQLSLFA